ncbi:phage/plasmid replication domain-containing protein [Mucilaginibacter defluvii]|uniref:Replication-associated protein G2P N-terminal domain-containing protein n=1 Tax=Mucilaginibacter defluvii TaxID=1196019 RepID=A0ABP9FSW5_9SPHI
MIDTIKLRLNNVSNYPLTKFRYEHTDKEGKTLISVDENTGECFNDTKVRAILHHDTGNIIPLTKSNSLYNASSNYKLLYKYYIKSDCLDFEFSIPKYLYGSNILQFVKWHDQDSDGMYRYLMGFIKSFFNKYSLEPIDFKDISIHRIDFSYNQFFNSKYDALKYLSEQKQLLPKYARSTKNDYTNYDTSLTYVTKRYSFKIYHKGTEFHKHDKRKLSIKNPTGIPLLELQDQSDRMLRYEITFRKAQIDYFFREKQLYSDYVKFFFNERSRKSFRQMQPQLYRDVLNFCERGHNYVCAPVVQATAIRTGDVHFSKPVFDELYRFFWGYVKKFQLNCKLSIMDVIERVDQKNKERDELSDAALRRKNSFNKPMVVALSLLTQYYSLDDLRKSNLLPRSTFFRYQKQLNELGVTSHGRLVDIPPPSLDYQEYLAIFGHIHNTH